MSDNPFTKPISGLTLVTPKRAPDGSVSVVILERIEPGKTPAYCIHGKVPCHWCDEWCWLGSESYQKVVSGEVAPMCRECGAELIPQGMKKIGHVEDRPHG